MNVEGENWTDHMMVSLGPGLRFLNEPAETGL